MRAHVAQQVQHRVEHRELDAAALARALAVKSAARIALHAKMPPLRSASGMPTRAGGRPGSPVIAMWPLIACTMMSSAG